MDKLYIVRHTDIALKTIYRGFSEDSGVFENHTNLRVFKNVKRLKNILLNGIINGQNLEQ